MDKSPSDHKVECTLVLSRIYNKPVERVWRAWSEEKEFGQWYVAGDDHVVHFAQSDFRVGGNYRVGFGPPGTKPWVEEGTFLEIVPNRKIVFQERVAREGEQAGFAVTRTSVEFNDLGGRTELVITTTGRDTWRAGEGWTPCMESLARFLDNN